MHNPKIQQPDNYHQPLTMSTAAVVQWIEPVLFKFRNVFWGTILFHLLAIIH